MKLPLNKHYIQCKDKPLIITPDMNIVYYQKQEEQLTLYSPTHIYDNTKLKTFIENNFCITLEKRLDLIIQEVDYHIVQHTTHSKVAQDISTLERQIQTIKRHTTTHLIDKLRYDN